MDSASGTRKDGSMVPSASYRAFGGGNIYCPGRNIAQIELFGLLVPVITGFDIEGADGPLTVPPVVDDVIPLGAIRPRWEPMVKISRRKGWEDVTWEYRS